MVRTTNKSCLNSIAVYEPGDPGHSMGGDCVRVGGVLCWRIISVLGTLPSSCIPAGGLPNKEGTGGSVVGREGAGVWLLELHWAKGQWEPVQQGWASGSAAEANPALLFLGCNSSELLQNRLLFPHHCWEPSACRMPVPAPPMLQHQPRD